MTKFTPEEVRRRDSRARWQKARIFHGGCYRLVRFKELTQIYWQGGARKRPVRLLVVAPVSYRTSKNGRQYYRQSAYLLTTDLRTDALVLLRKQLADNPMTFATGNAPATCQTMVQAAAA